MVDTPVLTWETFAMVWVMIGIMTLGRWPKSKAPWLLQYVVAIFLVFSWPIILAIGARK